MKKYNLIINIMFWILAVFILFVAILSVVMPEKIANSIFAGEKEEIVMQKEPVVIKEYVEIEEEVEWFYFIATAYSANDSSQGTNGITATGKEVCKGIIAVDPEIIPLGTEVEIKDMGDFTAEDTGSKIKGNRIDIYFESKEEAKEFGRQGVWLRIFNNSLELAEVLK